MASAVHSVLSCVECCSCCSILGNVKPAPLDGGSAGATHYPQPTFPDGIPSGAVAAKTPATSMARDADYLLDDNYLFGQNMTEHNPAVSPPVTRF